MVPALPAGCEAEWISGILQRRPAGDPLSTGEVLTALGPDEALRPHRRGECPARWPYDHLYSWSAFVLNGSTR